MAKQARFNISKVANYIYMVFLSDFFDDKKIYEVLPEKLTDSLDCFVHYYYANSRDVNAFGYVDVICDLYVKHSNGHPNWGVREQAEQAFNDCINKAINGTRMSGYEEFTLDLTNLRGVGAESGYDVFTQTLRVMIDYNKRN